MSITPQVAPHEVVPFNLDRLEHEVEATIARRPFAKAEDIGRLSAEAVLTQYEAAAKAVEKMGEAVKERITKLEGAMNECDTDLKIIAEAAEMIREKGKLVYVQIEEANALSQDVRRIANEFKEKMK